jgi:hypothetical protein
VLIVGFEKISHWSRVMRVPFVRRAKLKVSNIYCRGLHYRNGLKETNAQKSIITENQDDFSGNGV